MVESCGVCKIIGPGHPHETCRGALSRWLKDKSGSDIAEKTRCPVLEAPEANANNPQAEQLKLFEESSGEAVTSLASLPGVCVWGAISIQWTIVNTCQLFFLYFHVQVYSKLYRHLLITTCVQIFSRGSVT